MIVRDCQYVSYGWSKYKLGIVKNLVRDCQNLVRELSKFLSRFVKIRIRDILFVNLEHLT